MIAYCALFSLPGLLVVVMTIAGYFWGGDAVSGRLHSQVAQAMGSDTADRVQNIVKITSESKDSVCATIMGIGIILFGATRAFAQFQKSLNTIWKVKVSTSKSEIWFFLKTRIFFLT